MYLRESNDPAETRGSAFCLRAYKCRIVSRGQQLQKESKKNVGQRRRASSLVHVKLGAELLAAVPVGAGGVHAGDARVPAGRHVLVVQRPHLRVKQMRVKQTRVKQMRIKQRVTECILWLQIVEKVHASDKKANESIDFAAREMVVGNSLLLSTLSARYMTQCFDQSTDFLRDEAGGYGSHSRWTRHDQHRHRAYDKYECFTQVPEAILGRSRSEAADN